MCCFVAEVGAFDAYFRRLVAVRYGSEEALANSRHAARGGLRHAGRLRQGFSLGSLHLHHILKPIRRNLSSEWKTARRIAACALTIRR